MSDDAPPTSIVRRARDLHDRRPPPSAPPRRQSRHGVQAPARSHAALYTVGALGLAVLALAASLAGIFTVRTVQLVGRNLPAGAMLSAADVSGQNIFTVRSDLVLSRLAAVPSVEVTRVQTVFPDRVVIYAQLRQPAIIWKSPDATELVDRYGHVIGPAGRQALPVLAAAQPPDSASITAAGYAVRLLPAAPDGRLDGLSLDPRNGFTIRGRSGWQAVLGSADAQTLVDRIATLQALLGTLARHGRQLAFADLRHKGAYYRVRGT